MRTVPLPIEKMTLLQKMDVIQRVWDSLAATDAPLISPPWHREIIAERKESVKRGEKRMIPLNEFKAKLREELNAD